MTLNPDFLPERQIIEVTPNVISDDEWERSGHPAGDIEDDHGDFCTCIFCVPGA